MNILSHNMNVDFVVIGQADPKRYSGLTGRTRYRTTWFGKQVLQVEYRMPDYSNFALFKLSRNSGELPARWRDAEFKDFAELRLFSHHKNM